MKHHGYPYRPKVGECCLISPNCKNGFGFTFSPYNILWKDENFILYGKDGGCPVLSKLDNIAIKPLSTNVDNTDLSFKEGQFVTAIYFF